MSNGRGCDGRGRGPLFFLRRVGAVLLEPVADGRGRRGLVVGRGPPQRRRLPLQRGMQPGRKVWGGSRMRHGVFELPSALSSLALAARHDFQTTKRELKYLVLRKRKG